MEIKWKKARKTRFFTGSYVINMILSLTLKNSAAYEERERERERERKE